MIVVDASVLLELLLRTDRRLLVPDGPVLAPALIDVEVASALRRLTLAGVLAASAGTRRIRALARCPIERCPHEPLLARAWELREALCSYDAMYVALAERLRAPLWTLDQKLARTAVRWVELRPS